MAAFKRLMISALEIALFAFFVIGLIVLFRMLSGASTDRQDASPQVLSEQIPTEQVYPPPPNDEPLPDWITLPTPTDFPTPTEIPFPTPIPTPVVTPLPLAQPPIIPALAGIAPKAYTIVIRDGNTLRAVNSVDGAERLLLDLSAKSSLFLNNNGRWGAASPDGTKLALVLTNLSEPWRKGQPLPQSSIFLFDTLTGKLQSLVENGAEPVWSPDGNWIAYRNKKSLAIINIETGEIREVYKIEQQSECYVDEFDWSPTGDRLVFVEINDLFYTYRIAIADISGIEPISELIPTANYMQSVPSWSPTGKHIAYVKLAGEAILGIPEPYYALYAIRPDEGEEAELTEDLSVMGKPMWSPDGDWIVFYGSLLYEEPDRLTEIWLFNINDHDLKRLTSNEVSKTNESDPKWSPDGSQIIFLRDRQDLWTLSLSNGIEKKITSTSDDFLIIP